MSKLVYLCIIVVFFFPIIGLVVISCLRIKKIASLKSLFSEVFSYFSLNCTPFIIFDFTSSPFFHYRIDVTLCYVVMPPLLLHAVKVFGVKMQSYSSGQVRVERR